VVVAAAAMVDAERRKRTYLDGGRDDHAGEGAAQGLVSLRTMTFRGIEVDRHVLDQPRTHLPCSAEQRKPPATRMTTVTTTTTQSIELNEPKLCDRGCAGTKTTNTTTTHRPTRTASCASVQRSSRVTARSKNVSCSSAGLTSRACQND
jgi:hypothetical protein